MTDFDIGIGWQTWGNYDSVSMWAFSFYTNQGAGELTRKYFVMVMFTVLGFYVRVYLFGPGGKDQLKGRTG